MCEKEYKFFVFLKQLKSLREQTRDLPMPINGLKELSEQICVRLSSPDEPIPYNYREWIKSICDNLPDMWIANLLRKV